MSYAAIDPAIYEVYQPNTPWHAGARGWWGAPVPGWGQNPNLLDTHRKAIQGLGCGSGGCCGGCKGVGEGPLVQVPQPQSSLERNWPWLVGAAGLLALGGGLLLRRR